MCKFPCFVISRLCHTVPMHEVTPSVVVMAVRIEMAI